MAILFQKPKYKNAIRKADSKHMYNVNLIDFITFASMTTEQIRDLRDRIEALRRHL